ncbi:hypothetical protein [Shewanella phage FishSpeaker]|nr:hypothetical protein [Shewanella phage FishSpeaker]
MKIFEFSNRVKTHKTSELLFMLTHLRTSVEDLSNTLVRIEESHLGIEAKAAEWMVSKSLMREVAKVLRMDTKRPYCNVMEHCFRTIDAVCKELEKEITHSKEKVWNGATLTFKQAAVLDTINALENWVDYTYLCFDVLVGEGFGSSLSKSDLDLLNGTLRYYTGLTFEYSKGISAWKAEFDNVAEVVVTEENESVIEVSDKLRTRLTSNSIGIHKLNPKFWFDLGRSRYDLSRLEALNRYNEQLNMMINLANTKKSGGDDAVLENQINVYRNQININRAKQEEIVKRYE